MKKKPFWLLFTILASLVVLVGAAPIPEKPVYPAVYEIGKPGGKLTVSTISLPKTLNPYLAAETSSTDVIGQTFLGLLSLDPLTQQVMPALAESWLISFDKKTYVLTLRSGLKWSDGKPLTADDVVFTYNEVINNPLIPNNYRETLLVKGQFPQVSKRDARTVVFRLAAPFVPFLLSLQDPILPQHVFAGTTQIDAKGNVPFLALWDLYTPPAALVVNGPWQIQSLDPQAIHFKRNPHYYLKDVQGQSLPYLENLVFRVAEDEAQELAWFNAGEIDGYALGQQSAAQLHNPKAHLYHLGPSSNSIFVMFNQSQAWNDRGKAVVDPIKSAWFRNQKFRQALAHATDKDRMRVEIFADKAVPQDSHISEVNPFYNPQVPRYRFDLKQAQLLLSQAGFKKNAQGQLLDAQGHRVQFDLLTNQGNARREAICKLLQADWAKLGIQVHYKALPFSQIIARIDETLDWEVLLIGLTGSALEPHFGINSWLLDGAMHMFNLGHPQLWKGKKPTQYAAWEKTVQALYQQAALEHDFEKRKQLYGQAQILVAEQVPTIFTLALLREVALAGHVGNWRPHTHGGSGFNVFLWNSERLFLKP